MNKLALDYKQFTNKDWFLIDQQHLFELFAFLPELN